MIQEQVKVFWTKQNVKITTRADAFDGYASCCNVDILNSFNPELKLKDTKSTIENKLVTTLVLVLKKIESESATKYDLFYWHLKAETVINESDIDDNVFKSIYTKVISNIKKLLGKGSGWIIQ